MKLLNRKQFREMWEDRDSGLGEEHSPLWIPEQSQRKSRHFVCIRPLKKGRDEFWLWTVQNCRGQVLCYSSSDEDQEEWYGFTHKPDIVYFLLRWS